MPLTVSVVIPTFRRPHDLAACLDAILGQSAPPLEVIVVDNDAKLSAQPVVRHHEARYGELGMALHYRVSPKNSLPFARNLGVRLSQGDIVLFLDDDFILEEDYVREILKVYEAQPAALGVQGNVVNNIERPRFWRKIFFLPNVAPDTCRVLPSIRSISPLAPDTLIPCECLSGCNASYPRSILAEFPGDENLLKYSFAEDLDQSYRIFRRHPGTLWLTPFARGIHKVSPAGRVMGKEQVYIIEVYGLYLSHKLFPHAISSRAIYWWSFIGRILGQVKHPTRTNLLETRYRLGALCFCLRHLCEIRAGNLHFFNRTLAE